MRFNELCIRAGVRGILHTLKHLKMLDIAIKTLRIPNKSVVTSTSRWLRAPASGLVEPVREVITKRVKKNELLAYIHDPFLINSSVKVLSPFEGIVIGQALRAMATEGDALFHIASFKKISGINAYIDEFREEIINQ